LAREFEPSSHSIRAWVALADRQEGRREEATLALPRPSATNWPGGGVKCVRSGWSGTVGSLSGMRLQW
jgi:hypothetical protein